MMSQIHFHLHFNWAYCIRCKFFQCCHSKTQIKLRQIIEFILIEVFTNKYCELNGILWIFVLLQWIFDFNTKYNWHSISKCCFEWFFTETHIKIVLSLFTSIEFTISLNSEKLTRIIFYRDKTKVLLYRECETNCFCDHGWAMTVA